MTKGDRIRQLRKAKKITQIEMAKKLNTTKQTISKYEKGIVTNIPSDRLEDMAMLLDTTPEYILGWDVMSDEEQKNSDAIADITDKLFKNDDFLSIAITLSKLGDGELNRAKEIIELAFPGNV